MRVYSRHTEWGCGSKSTVAELDRWWFFNYASVLSAEHAIMGPYAGSMQEWRVRENMTDDDWLYEANRACLISCYRGRLIPTKLYQDADRLVLKSSAEWGGGPVPTSLRCICRTWEEQLVIACNRQQYSNDLWERFYRWWEFNGRNVEYSVVYPTEIERKRQAVETLANKVLRGMDRDRYEVVMRAIESRKTEWLPQFSVEICPCTLYFEAIETWWKNNKDSIEHERLATPGLDSPFKRLRRYY